LRCIRLPRAASAKTPPAGATTATGAVGPAMPREAPVTSTTRPRNLCVSAMGDKTLLHPPAGCKFPDGRNAAAAELSGNREKARTYYAMLVEVSKLTDADRPELEEARTLLAKI
jgi:hypothetical protein